MLDFTGCSRVPSSRPDSKTFVVVAVVDEAAVVQVVVVVVALYVVEVLATLLEPAVSGSGLGPQGGETRRGAEGAMGSL